MIRNYITHGSFTYDEAALDAYKKKIMSKNNFAWHIQRATKETSADCTWQEAYNMIDKIIKFEEDK